MLDDGGSLNVRHARLSTSGVLPKLLCPQDSPVKYWVGFVNVPSPGLPNPEIERQVSLQTNYFTDNTKKEAPLQKDTAQQSFA